MNTDKIRELQIPQEEKQRPQGSLFGIFLIVILLTGIAVFFAWPRAKDSSRLASNIPGKSATNSPSKSKAPAPAPSPTPANPTTGNSPDTILTVSGYIINRERIELSPRYMGTVTWIGVKKGDAVTNGQVVVTLDDAEYKARLHEVEGRFATAKAN